MAWKIQKNILTAKPEIVIDGFENGIADSPYEGIADMRNVNITTAPKQASVTFATAAITLPPTGYTGVAWSSDDATDVFTVASTAGFYNGMALTIVTTSGAGSGTAGNTYYVGNITPTTFKLYTNLTIDFLLDVTTGRTGTFTVPTFGTPADSVSSPSNTVDATTGLPFKNTFIMTTNGYVWSITYHTTSPIGGALPINTLQFLGNLLHSTAGSPNTGISVWKGYLFTFMNAAIDYIAISNLGGTVNPSANPSANWVYNWQATTTSTQGHRAVAATDNALYFCNATFVGSILENAGSTFNPATPATYTYNASALALPTYDVATCLAQLGTSLLVGGIMNSVYPWDRISTSFTYPLICAENCIKCIVSTNATAYIFAGNRGNIYITNGSNIDLFKKFPDSISGTVDPYYNWGWAVYLKNQLFFTVSATTNGGTAISNFAGIWAIDLTTKAFRMSNSLSYGTYAGTVPVLVPMGNIRPTGDSLFAGWLNSTGGVDYTSGSPYTNYEALIDSDIMNIGGFLTKNTFSNIEFKLAKPLVSGEKIKLLQRSNLTDSFVEIGNTTTAGLLSDSYPMNFENVQWLQIRSLSSSTASNPSYTPLLNITFRQ